MATTVQGLAAGDLLRTPTFRTPAFLTPDLAFDESHNVFESSFKEGNARLSGGGGGGGKGADGGIDAVSTASAAPDARQLVQPPLAAPAAAVDPFFRIIQDGTLSPFFGLSSHLISPSFLSAAVARDPLRSGQAYAPLGLMTTTTTTTAMAAGAATVAALPTSAVVATPSMGIAPSAMWAGPLSEDAIDLSRGMLSPQQEPSPPRSAGDGPSVWPHATLEAAYRSSQQLRLVVDTAGPSTWSRYGQFTPPDDSSPNSAGAIGNIDRAASKVEPATGSANAAPPPPPPPTTQAPGKRRRGRRSNATGDQADQVDQDTPPAKRRKRVSAPVERMAAPAPAPVAEASEATTEKAVEPAEEERKRSKFLERNRVAASKCRQKKKEWTSKLESKARALALERDQLSSMVASLKDQVLWLKGELLKHTSCDCDRIRQYLNREANNLAPPPPPPPPLSLDRISSSPLPAPSPLPVPLHALAPASSAPLAAAAAVAVTATALSPRSSDAIKIETGSSSSISTVSSARRDSFKGVDLDGMNLTDNAAALTASATVAEVQSPSSPMAADLSSLVHDDDDDDDDNPSLGDGDGDGGDVDGDGGRNDADDRFGPLSMTLVA